MSETGRAGRYQRTTNGLVGSLVVTLLLIGAFVAFRALNRSELEVRPERIDYLEAVAAADSVGVDVVHPAALPEGWMATSIDLVPGDRPAWGIGMLTAEGSFVGLRQEDESVDDLLEIYVDDEATEVEPLVVPGSLAEKWTGYEDAGGDTAYAAEVRGDTVLVYGSADPDQLEALIRELRIGTDSG